MGNCLSRCTANDGSPTPNGHTGGRDNKPAKPARAASGGAPRAGAQSNNSDAQILRYQIEPSAEDVSSPRDVRLVVGGGGPGFVVYQNGDRVLPGSTGGSTTLAHSRAPSSSSKPEVVPRNGSADALARTRAADDETSLLDAKLNALFDSYADDGSEDCILADGIERFCDDLGVRPDDFRVLVLAWKFRAETMCRFTRPEFVAGCRALGATDVPGIAARFGSMTAEVREQKDAFRDMYRWAYRFALDSDCGQRTLPVDIAVGMWRIVFAESRPGMLGPWLEFLEGHGVRGITRDTWDMFLNFIESTDEDLVGYDETEAWPSLFDDFVEWAKERRRK